MNGGFRRIASRSKSAANRVQNAVDAFDERRVAEHVAQDHALRHNRLRSADAKVDRRRHRLLKRVECLAGEKVRVRPVQTN